MLSKLFRPRGRPAAVAALPAGQRVYAIGDIHGRADLLDNLLGAIEADDLARERAETTIVLLGDIVDRGPDSAGAIDRLIALAAARPATRFLTGNHEEVFVAALAGDPKALRLFCRIGGRETILSYGMNPAEYESLDYDELATRLDVLVPAAHRAFLARFEDLIVLGDYAFVHAGIRPGIALDAQVPADLRWIRDPFLDHRGRLDKLVVHGHTIVQAVERRQHRIGIDTGAYLSGRLTALALEGDTLWELST